MNLLLKGSLLVVSNSVKGGPDVLSERGTCGPNQRSSDPAIENRERRRHFKPIKSRIDL